MSTHINPTKSKGKQDSSQLVKVAADRLRLGMYVAKLDRPWLGTPFLFQGFPLNDPEEIKQIRGLCQFVYVDVKKSSNRDKKKNKVEQLEDIPKTQYRTSVAVQDEIAAANQSYQGLLSQLRKMMRHSKRHGEAHSKIVKQSIKTCTESIIRNPNAMIWLSHVQQQHAHTAEHGLHVALLAISLGRHLGLPRQSLEILGLCGLLHDVGKSKVDREILDKPGKFSAEEWLQMQRHAEYGRDMLLHDPLLPPVVIEAVYSHHERIDGNGYPRGIAANELSFYTRIITIVDAYDAMISYRPYQSPRTSAEAIKIIYEERGTQFDQSLAVKFIESMGLYPPGSLIEMQSGEVGIVIAADPKARLNPTVALLTNSKKQGTKQTIVNLKTQQGSEAPLAIKQVLLDGKHGISVAAFTQSHCDTLPSA